MCGCGTNNYFLYWFWLRDRNIGHEHVDPSALNWINEGYIAE